MKKTMLLATCVCASLVGDASERCVTLRPGRTEVVVAPKASSVTKVAGMEMTNLLSRVLGAPVLLVAKPTDGKKSIVLGTLVLGR